MTAEQAMTQVIRLIQRYEKLEQAYADDLNRLKFERYMIIESIKMIVDWCELEY